MKSNSRRSRSPTRRNTASRKKSISSSTEQSPHLRNPTKASKHISPIKTPVAFVESLMADVSNFIETPKTPQKGSVSNTADTPSRRSKRDGSGRSLELVQGNLGNQILTCKVCMPPILYWCVCSYPKLYTYTIMYLHPL